ncbi:BolA family protein [Sideroxydans lithotrophicus]|jgi:acid stress-induced BolA-like protein IbaG/YrbA|uniref:BolA family protein n=1 Tax=Sideroxydans lithotrophicus (strain ES-1) TaxID=580332 RepID=D5CR95_SIDLE|nr:BolA/IbaG family iron-sulfur metabolism protein [Sideroxydans lithotrophicus]ADE11481.1 BolA family protein [Sideroxydans lithotrophicus ES-1]
MVTPENVKTYIQQGLDCAHISVEGDGRHFEAVIVSPAFEGKGMLQQHQLVYRALGDKMDVIHALSMKTFTPEQWAKQA